MRPKLLIAILIILALALPASPAYAGGVVTVCDEAHLLTALAGGGTVTFACSGTITLAAEITIATDTTIDGSGQTVTISGNNAVRVFYVNSGVTLNLNELTIANGNASIGGGGISNNGTVNVIGSDFSGNYAPYDGGGIDNYGTLTVDNSNFSDNSAYFDGGGIANKIYATLTVSNSNFLGNSAYGGGGITNAYSATLTVVNSTFSGNSAAIGSGGGINNDGTLTVGHSTFSGNGTNFAGGGIANWLEGTLTVSNSTFSGNSATSFGGGIHSSGTAAVNNCTFSDNSAATGGGIFNAGGTTVFKNIIVADSLIGNNCYGTITDGGGNLSYPDSTCPGINSNPLLGLLQNNGGPTWTMALGPGSAAINAGNDATCAAAPVNNFDQRGIARPQGAHCDIGAVEQYCPSFVPPGTVGVEDIVAIATRWGWTNATPGWDTIYDLNGDNKIDIVDITLLTRVWGATCS